MVIAWALRACVETAINKRPRHEESPKWSRVAGETSSHNYCQNGGELSMENDRQKKNLWKVEMVNLGRRPQDASRRATGTARPADRRILRSCSRLRGTGTIRGRQSNCVRDSAVGAKWDTPVTKDCLAMETICLTICVDDRWLSLRGSFPHKKFTLDLEKFPCSWRSCASRSSVRWRRRPIWRIFRISPWMMTHHGQFRRQESRVIISPLCQRFRQHSEMFFSSSTSSDKPKFARWMKGPNSGACGGASPLLPYLDKCSDHRFILGDCPGAGSNALLSQIYKSQKQSDHRTWGKSHSVMRWSHEWAEMSESSFFGLCLRNMVRFTLRFSVPDFFEKSTSSFPIFLHGNDQTINNYNQNYHHTDKAFSMNDDRRKPQSMEPGHKW
jgi:hypothetical protein